MIGGEFLKTINLDKKVLRNVLEPSSWHKMTYFSIEIIFGLFIQLALKKLIYTNIYNSIEDMALNLCYRF